MAAFRNSKDRAREAMWAVTARLKTQKARMLQLNKDLGLDGSAFDTYVESHFLSLKEKNKQLCEHRIQRLLEGKAIYIKGVKYPPDAKYKKPKVNSSESVVTSVKS